MDDEPHWTTFSPGDRRYGVLRSIAGFAERLRSEGHSVEDIRDCWLLAFAIDADQNHNRRRAAEMLRMWAEFLADPERPLLVDGGTADG